MKPIQQHRISLLAFLVAGVLATGAAFAEKRSRAGSGKTAKHEDRRDQARGGSAHFGEQHRVALADYYGEQHGRRARPRSGMWASPCHGT